LTGGCHRCNNESIQKARKLTLMTRVIPCVLTLLSLSVNNDAMKNFLGVLLLGISLQVARAEAPPALPEGGNPVVSADWIKKAALVQKAGQATKEEISVKGMPFTEALSVNVTEASEPAHRLSLQIPAHSPVVKGDILLLRFWVRRVAPEAEVWNSLSFQKATEPYDRSVTATLKLTSSEWTCLDVPFVARYDHPKGDAMLILTLGSAVQTLEIGGIELLNFGADKKIDDLPPSTLPANRIKN